jgi:hypothetical protein
MLPPGSFMFGEEGTIIPQTTTRQNEGLSILTEIMTNKTFSASHSRPPTFDMRQLHVLCIGGKPTNNTLDLAMHEVDCLSLLSVSRLSKSHPPISTTSVHSADADEYLCLSTARLILRPPYFLPVLAAVPRGLLALNRQLTAGKL